MQDNKAAALSVSMAADYIKQLISENISKLWIRGEVSNLKIQNNGNVYFTLKDENAKLNCMMMRYSAAKKHIPNLKNGIEILLFGNISYYPKESYITVFVEDIEFLGQGLLQQKFEELKAKLAKEGLFDSKHKKPLPKFPNTVAVITSATGAAVQDILNVTKRRFQSVNIVVFPAAVQGDAAVGQIVRAIRVANKYANKIDVLIVGRGGGSIEDLWCFNEETVARAIYNSEIPVISAVGHEIDFTIADFVADKRAPTPSAAAELVVKDRNEIQNYLKNLHNRINNIIENKIETIKLKLETKGTLYFKNLIQTKLADNRMHLDNLTIRFKSNFKSYFDSLQNKIAIQREKLIALNPNNILSRGYSITYKLDDNGEAVNIFSAEEVKTGNKIKTFLHNGNIVSTVD